MAPDEETVDRREADLVERVASAIWRADRPADESEKAMYASYFDMARAAVAAVREAEPLSDDERNELEGHRASKIEGDEIKGEHLAEWAELGIPRRCCFWCTLNDVNKALRGVREAEGEPRFTLAELRAIHTATAWSNDAVWESLQEKVWRAIASREVEDDS